MLDVEEVGGERARISTAIAWMRSTIPALSSACRIRSRRSRTASVTAPVIDSPVRSASSLMSRVVSAFLMLRLMVESYHVDGRTVYARVSARCRP